MKQTKWVIGHSLVAGSMYASDTKYVAVVPKWGCTMTTQYTAEYKINLFAQFLAQHQWSQAFLNEFERRSCEYSIRTCVLNLIPYEITNLNAVTALGPVFWHEVDEHWHNYIISYGMWTGDKVFKLTDVGVGANVK